MSEYVVYVLRSLSSSDKTYTGFTSDLISRIQSHNVYGKHGHTNRYRPWEVVYIEFYSGKSDALKREKFFKSGAGRDHLKLILVQ